MKSTNQILKEHITAIKGYKIIACMSETVWLCVCLQTKFMYPKLPTLKLNALHPTDDLVFKIISKNILTLPCIFVKDLSLRVQAVVILY